MYFKCFGGVFCYSCCNSLYFHTAINKSNTRTKEERKKKKKSGIDGSHRPVISHVYLPFNPCVHCLHTHIARALSKLIAQEWQTDSAANISQYEPASFTATSTNNIHVRCMFIMIMFGVFSHVNDTRGS